MHHQLKVHDSSTCGLASHKLRQLSTEWNCYEYSILSATIPLWNTLPLEVHHLPSLEQFQHALTQISISSHLHRRFGIFINVILCLHREKKIKLSFCCIVCAGVSTLKLSTLHLGKNKKKDRQSTRFKNLCTQLNVNFTLKEYLRHHPVKNCSK